MLLGHSDVAIEIFTFCPGPKIWALANCGVTELLTYLSVVEV